jgi:hypothetical protein
LDGTDGEERVLAFRRQAVAGGAAAVRLPVEAGVADTIALARGASDVDDVTLSLPDDLETLDDQALEDVTTAHEEALRQLLDDESDDLARMDELAAQIQTLRAEIVRRDELAAANAAHRAELAATLEVVDQEEETPDEDGDEDGDGDDEEGEEGESEEEPAAEPAPESVTPDEVIVPIPVPVAASTTNPPLRPLPTPAAAARRRPRPEITPARGAEIVITASADIPGMSVGAHFEGHPRLLRAMHEKARPLPDHSPYVPVATIQMPVDHWMGDSPVENGRILAEAIGEVSDAEALVASGGWCAPSVPVFETFRVDDAENLLTLPTIGIRGGGVQLPVFDDALIDAATDFFVWTEATDITPGAETKACVVLPCPTWEECRPTAYGLCVTAGNMQDRAWPEYTSSFIDQAMNAYLHWTSAQQIAAVATTATAVTFAGENSDAAGDLLSALELYAAALRSRYSADGAAVSVVLPAWTIEVLRADVAKRAGVDLLGISDGEIVSWLTNAGIAPQFAGDYQKLWTTGAAPTNWPASIKFLMNFAGAYVLGDAGEIDLGVVRDSTLNATNDFTAAWFERFWCVLQVGPPALEVTVEIGVDGVTACCPAA